MGLMDTYREERPWGRFEQFTHNEASTVKLIFVRTGGCLSLQRHRKRDGFWKVVAGSPRITIDGQVTDAHEGDEFSIPRGITHRIESPEEGSIILEIATGDFDEADIERLEDSYRRV